MKRTMTVLAVAMLLIASACSAAHARPVEADDIVGKWESFKDRRHQATIEISRTGKGTYEGRIVWGDRPERLDAKNPDPSLRSRLIVGMVILRDFRYKGENDWSGGRIYDPDSGNEYRSYMRLDDDGRDRNVLRLRGYIGISLLGRTEKWIRASGNEGK
ncbi:MAG: DUF2147 domain-containing protein [Chlorobiaceae bacterium]|nr:DUF2147 domain-containing protein [Chlorobiaceae bacterium]NTW74776.1 DUF2147 domain-containing protein [Chlorobiaceae bacterium]